jgi:glycosyltransferase involved in cell wall biosynthesis
MPSIGLVMIVKNEAHVIERCLASVRPIIDHIVIADTGSSDNTRELIADFIAREGLGGGVVDHPWRNFAHNRSAALAALRTYASIDYGFTIDADETLVLEEGFDSAAFKASLDADVYDVEIRNGGLRYLRPSLFSNRKPFFYKAVLHEYLEAPPGATRGTATGLHVLTSREGARSQNPNKYADDAALLERELLAETDPELISRYTFYLAQSLRDSGQPERAHAAYLQRAEQGGWREEVYVSVLRAAQLSETLNHPVDEQLATYLRAYEILPTRAEALNGAAAVCRKAGRYQLGYLLARQGIAVPRPHSGLFLDQTVYDYRMLDEFQVNAYWAGHYGESLDAGATLLRDALFPEGDRARIVANCDFALEKVTGQQRST